ncbi:MAG: 3-phosphoserine/phosphohydroxythreonine transaminase, partial [Flavobacteriaceae bacterium]
PKGYMIPNDLDYLHLTSNNTIFGTQIKEFPKSKVPLICDMSSDIFSRQMDFSQFDLIYAGAQKNMGPAGTTLVVVKEEILGQVSRKIPSMMDYQVHIAKDSMFNTPSVFAVYVCMLTLEWLKELGGIEGIEEINEKKAKLIYSEVDLNPLFNGFAKKEDRSNMNATFTLADEKLKDTFDSMWKEAGINGLSGHRSVGGYRASMYNALPLESVGVLVDVMGDLERGA